eukprot:563216-Alexandrium_andersonii.AAC.1
MSASLVGSEMCIRDRCEHSLPVLYCAGRAPVGPSRPRNTQRTSRPAEPRWHRRERARRGWARTLLRLG